MQEKLNHHYLKQKEKKLNLCNDHIHILTRAFSNDYTIEAAVIYSILTAEAEAQKSHFPRLDQADADAAASIHSRASNSLFKNTSLNVTVLDQCLGYWRVFRGSCRICTPAA